MPMRYSSMTLKRGNWPSRKDFRFAAASVSSKRFTDEVIWPTSARPFNGSQRTMFTSTGGCWTAVCDH
jgi:hypothetical protein